MQFNITKTIEENKNVIDTNFIYNKTFKRFEQKNGENWIVNESQLKKIILEPTGFSLLNNETDIYSSNMSFSNDGTRIFSIMPTNEHFVFYVNGKEYIKTDVSQVQLDDIEGLHYIYFNNNGVLEAKTNFSLSDIMRKYASVATIYWDYTNKKPIYIGDKRHAITRDAYQNYLDFVNDKTVDYIDGTFIKFTNENTGAVNNKVDGDGSSNYHTSFTLDAGKYKNYDLLNDTEHIEFNEDIPIFYKQTITQEKNWLAMATNGTVIVAIANDGEYRLMISADDAETWQRIYLPYYCGWTDIIYAQNKFVAVSESGDYSVVISLDGYNWTFVPVSQKNKWQSLTYGDGLFVAVGANGINTIMYSYDAKIWNYTSTPTYLALKSVTYMPAYNGSLGKFITTSQESILNNTNSVTSKSFQSFDGKIWTSLNTSHAKTWNAINYGNNMFIALANSGKNRLLNVITNDTSVSLASSEPMETNNAYTIDNNNWSSITYAFGYHMAVSNGTSETNKFIRSTDGFSWESFNTINPANAWKKITYNSNLIVAIATDGTNRITYSDAADRGAVWSSNNSQDTKIPQDIIYGNDKWVLVCSFATSGGRIAYSTSATLSSWTNVTTYDTNSWYSVAYSSIYVAVGTGTSNTIIYSTDGITWTPSVISVTKNWTRVKYLYNGFFALNSDNEIYYSVDGKKDWYKLSFTVNVTGLTFTNFSTSGKLIVFLTNTNKIVVTGVNLTVNGTLGTFDNNKLLNIIDNLSLTSINNNGNGTFVIGTKENKVMTSTDNGTTWIIKNIIDSAVNKVKYINGKFFLISTSGLNRIAYSSNAFDVTKYITTSVLNYPITDLIYNNNNYFISTNYGDSRIIKISDLVYGSQESELTTLIKLKQAIKDIYNSWRKQYDATRDESVKNRCIVKNNKINYNKYSNNYYGLETCVDNKFYLYHLFLTNDKDNKYAMITGNYEYDNKEEAKNSIIDEINKLSGLPFNDFLPLGTIIYEVNSTYTNSSKARIVNINGNNYYKLIKKDLIVNNNSNNQISIKKENINLLNNTDLINLYGNKILEYALNKLQNLVNRDIDNYITRQEITLSNGVGNTTSINTIFGSQMSGFYEIFDKNNPELSMILFLKQNGINLEPDINITSYTSLILPSKKRPDADKNSLLGVYIENYLVNFVNFTSNAMNLVIYRKL